MKLKVFGLSIPFQIFALLASLAAPLSHAVTPPVPADCKKSYVHLATAQPQGALVSNRVPGLFDSVAPSPTWKLPDGTIQFQDTLEGNKLVTLIDFAGQGAHGKGLLLLSAPTQGSVSLDVIYLENSFPRMIQPSGQVELVAGKGSPASSLITMRGLKRLGTLPLQTFTMHTVRNAETVLSISAKIKAHHQQTNDLLITADQFIDFYKDSPLHRLAETALTQAGYKINQMHLQMVDRPTGPGKILPGNTKIWSPYSYATEKGGPPSGTESTYNLGLSYATNIRHKYINAAELEEHVDKLTEQADAQGLNSFPFSFSIVYDVAPVK